MVIGLMDWFNWLMIGLLAGWLMAMVMKTKWGLFTDIGLGIAGAFIGGFLLSQLSLSNATGFNVWTWVSALVGAVALVAVFRLFPRTPEQKI